MVAHVEAARAGVQHLDQLGIAVPEVIGAAVEMNVDQTLAVHVVEAIALAAVDDQVDPRLLPELGLVRIPEGLRGLEHLKLGFTHGNSPGPRFATRQSIAKNVLYATFLPTSLLHNTVEMREIEVVILII